MFVYIYTYIIEFSAQKWLLVLVCIFFSYFPFILDKCRAPSVVVVWSCLKLQGCWHVAPRPFGYFPVVAWGGDTGCQAAWQAMMRSVKRAMRSYNNSYDNSWHCLSALFAAFVDLALDLCDFVDWLPRSMWLNVDTICASDAMCLCSA